MTTLNTKQNDINNFNDYQKIINEGLFDTLCEQYLSDAFKIF